MCAFKNFLFTFQKIENNKIRKKEYSKYTFNLRRIRVSYFIWCNAMIDVDHIALSRNYSIESLMISIFDIRKKIFNTSVLFSQ